MGKSPINWPFSMAMLNNRRVELFMPELFMHMTLVSGCIVTTSLQCHHRLWLVDPH